MSSEGADRRLEGIRCPTCRGHFDLIRILGRYGGSYKLLVRCPRCNVYGIGTAQAQSLDASLAVAASASAASAAPGPANRPTEPVSESDVAAMHDFLSTFDGNFRALWSTERDN